MIDRSQIEKPVLNDFRIFREEFASALCSEIQTIQSAVDTVRQTDGKQLRPLLLLLTAKACGGVDDTSIRAAILLELLHTASLIHDDVVDETKQRRGRPSINAIYDNRVAVLVGDFILSNALIRAAQTGSTQIIHIIALLCREMTEGEIKQLENIDHLIPTEQDYFIALRKKTATLLASCTEIGAITAGASIEIQRKCKQFGQLLGYGFQIRDDIFDYFDDASTGKPNGNDIREGKVTLPLLYALQSADKAEKETYLAMLADPQITPENALALIRFAKAKGGIEYAQRLMMEYKRRATEIIHTLPDSEAKDSLLLLADYLVERSR
jgi:octaprenyl-diphosphate synthase